MDLSPRYSRAIAAIDELLMKLRLEWTFVGSIARAAWLGGVVDGGSIDVVALMKPEQKNQVAMMASNRGFYVDREEIDRSEELDLVPLHFDDVRVHVLVASNALYAKMIGAARTVIRQAWWMSVFPGIAILLTVLAINLVGEGLNDTLNPRIARKWRPA